MLRTPAVNRVVSRAELLVRTEMNDGSDDSCGRAGPNDVFALRELLIELDADLETNARVPGDRHVAPGLELPGADELPDNATIFGHEARKFGGACQPAYHGDGDAASLRNLHVLLGHVRS